MRDLAKMMYWAARKDRRAIPHLLGAIVRVVPNYARWLRWTKIRPANAVALVMVEHMGDIVMAEPLARHVRQANPGATLIWVAAQRYAELPSAFGSVDHVLRVRCVTDWILLRLLLPPLPVHNLHITGHCCARCQIPLTGSKTSAVTHANYFDFGNLTEVQCLNAGLPRITAPPLLAHNDHAAARVGELRLPARYIVIHCKSNHADRDWVLAHWQSLVGYLTRYYQITVVEVGLVPVATAGQPTLTRNLCGALSTLETAEVIRGADLFIGIDSGPAHLANAVTTPGVILMGAYRGFTRHMPFSGGYASGVTGEVVRAAGPASEITLEAVLYAVHRRLAPCQPGANYVSL